MESQWQRRWFQLGLAAACGIAGSVAPRPDSATAQITPDETLGAERSQLTPSDNIRGLPGLLIQGGAQRGSNLFQSFRDFNIGEGQRVYFANPAGIDTIFGRVTGPDVSRIMGTLGVDGAANLFLLNPNGILFGQNARLDIAGSFVASTSERVEFENGTQFSATSPGGAPLLTVNLRPRSRYGTPRGTIDNAGTLSVGAGQTLTLLGTTVTNTGLLTAAGGTVEVLGNQVALLDQARIDVSSASGGGTVLIGGEFQGNGPAPNATQTLVGPNVLISADGTSSTAAANGGQVIVWADDATRFYGSVSARGGAAGGNGGFVEISGAQNLAFAGRVDVSAPLGQLGTVLFDPQDITIVPGSGFNDGELSDGTILEGDNGAINFRIGADTLTAISGNVTLQASRDITFNAPVNITTPGAYLEATAGNDITVNQNISTEGGNIRLFAQSGVFLNGVTLDTNPSEAPGTAAGTVELSGRTGVSLLNSVISARSYTGRGPDFNGIGLVAAEGSVTIRNSSLSATNRGTGFAGDVVITARDEVNISDSSIFSRGSRGRIFIGESDYSDYNFSPETISISATRIETSNDSAPVGTTADAGRILIQATGAVSIVGESEILSNAGPDVLGNAGGVGIAADSLYIDNSEISTSALAQGSTATSFSSIPSNRDSVAGAVVFFVNGNITLRNSEIFNNLENGASGEAGDVLILADSLNLYDGSQIQTIVRGNQNGRAPAQGTAGNIVIFVNETIRVAGVDPEGFSSLIASTVESGGTGTGGTIYLEAKSVQVLDIGGINASNRGAGPAGDIFVSARAVWLDNRARIDAFSLDGQGGNIFFDVPGAVILGRNSNISTSTLDANIPLGEQAGNIAIGSGNLLRIASPSGTIAPAFDGRTLIIAGKTPRDSNILSVGVRLSLGGNIRVNAFNLQDIAKRPDAELTNDISTESLLFDVDGETVVDTLNIDPSQRPAPLREDYREPRIADGCDPRGRSEPNRFTIVGRGGTQTSATEQPGARPLSGGWAAPPATPQQASTPSSTPPSTAEPVSAQGWTVAANGEIILTATGTQPLPQRPRSGSIPCYAP